MKEEIVLPAWEVASQNTNIKIFNFFPSFLSTLYLAGILLYQISWSYINVFHLKDELFHWVIDFSHSAYFFETMMTFGIFFIFFIIVIPITEWGLVALIDRVDSTDRKGLTSQRGRTLGFGFGRGLRHFLPIFEANNITALFKLISIITFTLFLIRIFGMEYLKYILGIMSVYFGIAVVINVFLAYTRFFIVLENMKAFDAIVASSSMALEHLGITFKLYLTLILVYIRTLLTVLVLIVFPFALSAILTYVSVAGLQILFISLVSVMLVIFFVFVSHLNSVLEIFVETLWYRAYRENQAEDLKHGIVHGHASWHSEDQGDGHALSHGHGEGHGHTENPWHAEVAH